MREIKFRAWIENRKLMSLEVLAIRFSRKDQYQVHLRDKQNFEWLTGAILMQFTGLHDKNGKEIYEGDIVQRKTMATSYVIWELGRWRFNRHLDGYISLWEATEKGNIEVIGNIYEYPELLEIERTER